MTFFPLQRFTVFGDSMLPTLRPEQDVLCFNWAYIFSKPKTGDIVVIKVNGKEMVKRIQTSVDRHIFVIGDNKRESTDSRKFGPISVDKIIGKVIWY